MAATGFTPISLYYSTTAAAVPTAGNLVPGELAINITDGKLYYENNSGVVTLLASSSGASGDVVGPASATDNAIARFDGTTGKLIQNSAVTIADTTGNMAGVGTLSSGAITTTGVLTVTAGTNSAPAITTTGDTNTGIFFPAADTIAFTEGGVESMRIDSAARLLVGNTTSNNLPYLGTQFAPGFQNYATSGTGGFYRYSADSDPSVFTFTKSRNATIGSQTIVNSGDNLGYIGFAGSDGTNFITAASIVGMVDGVPGTNDMPGRLVFSTTADGASTPTERMRITSTGNVGIGTSAPAQLLEVAASNTGLTSTTANNTIRLTDTDTTSATNQPIGKIEFYSSDANAPAGVKAYVLATSNGVQPGSSLSFATANTAADATEAMRIDSSGNVGIGTTTPSAQLQVAGSSSVSALKIPNIEEVATVSATAATGTINYDITTQSVLFYTSNATANWTVNFRGSSGTSLNTLMATGESMSCTFLVTQGATAYYNSAVQVDGTTSGVTTRWQGSAPTSGNASSLDSYTYVIIKTGSATFTVLATQTKFA